MARAGLLKETAKKSSWPVTGLWNRGTLKDLNDSKLIVNESKWFPWSSRINLIPFRIFRGPLFHKPVTAGQELFLLFFTANRVYSIECGFFAYSKFEFKSKNWFNHLNSVQPFSVDSQNQHTPQILFHKNCSPRDLCIMTLFAICTSIAAESFSNEPKLSTSDKVTKLVRSHEKQSTLDSQGSRGRV